MHKERRTIPSNCAPPDFWQSGTFRTGAVCLDCSANSAGIRLERRELSKTARKNYLSWAQRTPFLSTLVILTVLDRQPPFSWEP